MWKRRSLAGGKGIGVGSMPTGSFRRGGLMLQDPPPAPMNSKETSLMTHPDASMMMYDISNAKTIFIQINSSIFNNYI